MKHFVVGLALTLMIAIAAAPAAYAQSGRGAIEGSFDRTLNVSGTVDLDVATGSGGIEIRQSTGNRVEVHGKIRVGTDRTRSDADSQDLVRRLENDPPIEQSGNRIRIGHLQGRDYERNVSISYEILIPSQSSVKSNTGSGSQTITGIVGPVEANTGSGSISLTNIRGKVIAETGSGSIRAAGLNGTFTGNTGSGSITVEGEQTGPWSLETGSGTVNIHLPQNAAYDLNAHTGSGGVTVDAPITMQGRLDGRRQDVSGKVRGGGPALDVRTGSGSIRID